ncbi:TonB-dependent receptor [Parabacteroides pacaensis]|uniref:TonB-dependent receptor n=1 Tax=Parabacteroides pacaensis TaxID=2086575 RepID=UPI000D10B934|nr:TonB-dependent receptor [Parabacteroides pacaensis]
MNKQRIYYLKRYFYSILPLFFSFSVSVPFTQARGYEQAYEQSLVQPKKMSVKEALQAIEKNSGLSFMYDADMIDLNRKITLDVTRQKLDVRKLEALLKEIFKGTDITYEISGNQIILASKNSLSTRQSISTKKKKITGKVLDVAGLAVIGANIVIKGTAQGATTNTNGSFSLEAVPGDVLQISYIGYIPQDIKVGNKDVYKITLREDTQILEEVVVVGYGSQRKINVTGSIVQIDTKELKTAPSGNLSSMLQGRLPGLITKQPGGQPGADGASLLVRGLNTLGNNNPLVIVDGVERPFPNVNPDEIESITVLKDATSAAVYGVRASNGVILVTTQRGVAQKPTVTFNTSAQLSMNTSFPKFLNGPDFAYWYDKAQELDGIPEGSSARWFTPDEIERIKNGDPQGIFGNTDWFNLLFKDFAPTFTNNISLNGGNDRFKYFVSLGTFNQNGIIDHTGYNRYNVRANLDAQVIKNLSISFKLAANQSEQYEPGLSAGLGNSYRSIFSQALMSYPFLPAYTASGIPVGSLNPGNGNQNPLAARDLSGKQQTRANRFQGSLGIKYDLPYLKGLSANVNLSYDKGYSIKKSVLLPYLISEYNVTKREYKETYAGHALNGQAAINQWFSDEWTSTVQTSLNYDNKFGKHAVNILALYEYTETNGTGMSAGRKNFPIQDIMDLTYGEEVIDELVKGGHSNFKRAGYVTRINYSFDDRYLFEFTGRIDGSTRLPSHNRWGFFPGVALGWRISNEPFLKDKVSFLDNLKIRLSAGKLGNDNIGSYAYMRTMSMGKDPVVIIGTTPGRYLGVDRVPNTDIKWESTTSYNLGLEAGLWNGLLGMELDLFYMKTQDILQAQGGLMPPSMGGYFPATLNSGIVDNRGFELILTHRNKIGSVNYNVRGNISWARNKIIETTEDANIPDYLRVTGKPIGQKYGFVAERLFQTQDEIDKSALYGPTLPGDIKLKDLNGDGRITRDQDRMVIGRSNTPEMMFGLNIGAEWKGFDMNVFFQGAALCDVALCGTYSDRGIEDNTFYTKPFYCDGNTPYYLVEGAWRPDHTDAEYPRLGIESRANGGKSSSWWVKSGAYLRLKNAQLGYTLPQRLTRQASIERIRCYLAGGNLFTLDALPYLDPEMPDVNQGYYPQQRTVEFGINITF